MEILEKELLGNFVSVVWAAFLNSLEHRDQNLNENETRETNQS